MIRKNTELKRSKIEELKEKYAETKNTKYRRKLYHLFVAQIDDLSASYIKKLDEIIDRISNELMANGGWCIARKDIVQVNSKKITPEYRTLTILRDENGYHQQDNPPVEVVRGSTRKVEERFLKERRIELDILHKALLMKDDITYNRRYTLKDPTKDFLVEELREFLGYNNPENTILPTKEQKETMTF